MINKIIKIAFCNIILLAATSCSVQAATSPIQTTVPTIYQVDFSSKFFSPELKSNESNKVGEITITCNTTEFYLKFYTSNNNYIYNNQSWLVNSRGSISNEHHRLAYKVYFSNSQNMSHSPEENFPLEKENAAIPTAKSTDNSYHFTGSSPTLRGKYDVNIVINKNQLQSVMAGSYISTLTFILSDS